MTSRRMTPEESRKAERTPLFPILLIAALPGFSVVSELEFGREAEAS
jgi:hypothetical protein